MSFIDLLLPVLIMCFLSVGWIVVQFMAKKAGTKNHFDNPPTCGNCNCGTFCELEMETRD